eukprot:1193003-Prorocentrum_minimum.AAC.1
MKNEKKTNPRASQQKSAPGGSFGQFRSIWSFLITLVGDAAVKTERPSSRRASRGGGRGSFGHFWSPSVSSREGEREGEGLRCRGGVGHSRSLSAGDRDRTTVPVAPLTSPCTSRAVYPHISPITNYKRI